MTSTEISLVQDSFCKLAPIADQAAALFYARLFELDPALRGLFRGDMQEQGRKLMAMIGTAVAALKSPETLLPAVRALGARHASYQVKEEHYATVGSALLWTLEKGLGSEFNPEMRSAWSDTYSLLAQTMIDAQRTARVAA